MKLRLIFSRSLPTIIFLLSLPIAGYIYFHFAKEIKPEGLLAIFVALSTAYFGITKQISEDNKALRDLFISFNEKYSEEMNDVFNLLRQTQTENQTINIKQRLIIIDYFNLCSEEYYWFRKNVIPFAIWGAWEAGMIENISIPQVQNILMEETDSDRKKKSYYGFAEYILKAVKNAATKAAAGTA